MNLNILGPRIVEFSRLAKHARRLHYLRDGQASLMPSEFNLGDFSFKSIVANQFSTASALFKSKDKFKDKKKVVHVDLNEIADVVKVDRMVSQFDAAIEGFKEQMVKHLGVRTRAGSVERLPVRFEDEEYNLEELVEISRKPNMIVLNISSFPQLIPNILETLEKSQMNLNPQQEGTTVYIPLPKVTKEYRESLAKTAKQYFVKCKDLISDIRNEHVRELKRKENVPTDLVFKGESYITALQKEYVDKADLLLKTKQKELLGES